MNIVCEVMVQTVGSDSLIRPTQPVHFRVAGTLTGRVERWAAEPGAKKGVIKQVEVRLASSTVFVPALSVLDPSNGGLFDVERLLGDIDTCKGCGHLSEQHIECVDFTSATGCFAEDCTCNHFA